ncbi:hypothetical protein HBI83_258080 [Parastagonospora nodorum]|nr:hypothetical protein HBI83_258080 [Parastagonospora nodorum]
MACEGFETNELLLANESRAHLEKQVSDLNKELEFADEARVHLEKKAEDLEKKESEALLKIQDQEQAADNQEHDVSAHQKCIATLQEELLAKGTKILTLESNLLGKTLEMDGIELELRKRNVEVHSLKKELEQYMRMGQLRIVAGSRPSPAFDSVSIWEGHDHAKASLISEEHKERCLAYESASAEDPYEASEASQASEASRESSIRSALSPNLDSSGGLGSSIDEDGEGKTRNHFVNLAEELKDVGEILDDDCESETSDYFAEDSTLAVSGNEHDIDTGCKARTCGHSAESNPFDVVNGQKGFHVSNWRGIELEPPQCATNHLMHQDSRFTSDTTNDLSSDIEMIQDVMVGGNGTNMQ